MDVSHLPPSLLQRIFPGAHTFTNQNKQSLVSRILSASTGMMAQPPIDTSTPSLFVEGSPSQKPIEGDGNETLLGNPFDSINSETAAMAELESKDPFGSISSEEAAEAELESIEFNGDGVGYFAALLRALKGTTNKLMLDAFFNVAIDVEPDHTYLLGMPVDSPFNIIWDFIKRRNITSYAAYIQSQANCALLRCRVAYNMNQLQKLDVDTENPIICYPLKQIIGVIQLVRIWVEGTPLLDDDAMKESLIDTYWLLRNEVSIAPNLPDPFYGELIKYELKDLFDIVAKLESDLPSIEGLNLLPGALLSHYNLKEQDSQILTDDVYWGEIRTIVSDALSHEKPPLLQSCLLFLLSNCDPDIFQDDEEARLGFTKLLANPHFKAIVEEASSFTARIFLDKPAVSDVEKVQIGACLLNKTSDSPVVMMALLLIVIDHLEQNLEIKDNDDVENIVCLLSEIHDYIDELPSPIRDRAKEGLTKLLSQYDQIRLARNREAWSQLKEKYQFTEFLLSGDFTSVFALIKKII